MHVAIGMLLIALLFLGCWALSYAIILMRPHVQELRAEKRAERERRALPSLSFQRATMTVGAAIACVVVATLWLVIMSIRS
jgi:hypothetical protein